MSKLNIELQNLLNITEELCLELVALSKNLGELEITSKPDGTYITNVDKLAHDFLISNIKKLTPDLPIISEEDDAPSFAERQLMQKYWLIDPLDGTNHYIKGTDEYTINIALIEHNRPILGIVAIPASNEIYFAQKGGGACKMIIGKEATPLITKQYIQGEDLVLAVGSSTDNSKILNVLQKRGNSFATVRLGAAIKICKLAEGQINLYARLDKCCEWDTAAAHCILNETGGVLFDITTGREVEYNKNPNLKSAKFIAGSVGMAELIKELSYMLED